MEAVDIKAKKNNLAGVWVNGERGRARLVLGLETERLHVLLLTVTLTGYVLLGTVTCYTKGLCVALNGYMLPGKVTCVIMDGYVGY